MQIHTTHVMSHFIKSNSCSTLIKNTKLRLPLWSFIHHLIAHSAGRLVVLPLKNVRINIYNFTNNKKQHKAKHSAERNKSGRHAEYVFIKRGICKKLLMHKLNSFWKPNWIIPYPHSPNEEVDNVFES